MFLHEEYKYLHYGSWYKFNIEMKYFGGMVNIPKNQTTSLKRAFKIALTNPYKNIQSINPEMPFFFVFREPYDRYLSGLGTSIGRLKLDLTETFDLIERGEFIFDEHTTKQTFFLSAFSTIDLIPFEHNDHTIFNIFTHYDLFKFYRRKPAEFKHPDYNLNSTSTTMKDTIKNEIARRDLRTKIMDYLYDDYLLFDKIKDKFVSYI